MTHLRGFAVLCIALWLAGCQAMGPSINVAAVLDRTATTLQKFHAYLVRYEYREVDSEMFNQFNATLQRALNKAPKLHSTAIATRINADASIEGYGDVDADGKVGAQEPKLFLIEMDPDNNRIILTTASGYQQGQSMPGSRGFFSGVFIASLMDRQQRAGIRSGHFDQRRVAMSGSSFVRASASAPTARSRAKSGGVRGGK